MLHAFKRKLLQLETIVASSSLMLLLLLALIQIIARNVFETGFPLLEVISRHLVLFVIFFGAGLVTEQSRHIKIDIIAHLLSPRQQAMLVRPLLALGAMLCAALAWYAGLFWLDEWQYAPVNERWSAALAIVIPIGFSVLALHFLLLSLPGSEAELEAETDLSLISKLDETKSA